ncbi:MAG: FmdB family zinc ribbon protein [Dehalococcoidia bacterium]
MPIYDYECASCGRSFELRQSFDAETEEVCPVCGGRARRRFHPVGVIFKGSGWYVNDYGRKSSTLSGDDHQGEAKKESSEKESSTASQEGGS